jgi:hypothetical protein
MDETSAAKDLSKRGGKRRDVAPPEGLPVQEAAAVDEPAPQKPSGPPPKKFKWMDTSTITIDHWLAGQYRADIEVFPGKIYSFREPTSVQLRERDRFLNTFAGESSMGGDRLNMAQWGRMKNVGTLVQSVAALNEKPWPPGDNFEKKFNSVEGLGAWLMDRIVLAYMEFEDQLVYLVQSTDLPNS